MNLIKKVFKRTTLKKEVKSTNVSWIALNSIEQIKEIQQYSYQQPLAVFKHSTRCGISRIIMRQFENSFDESMRGLKVYYLDLLSYRDVSNEIASEFQVTHQSPQLIMIKDGIALENASHSAIESISLKKYI